MTASSERPSRRTLLVVSQVYVPDPAAVGQHMADAAQELARRGHRVIVYTSDRGYDDPSVRYQTRETLDGVEVRRLPASSFGKRTIIIRLIAQFSFVLQVAIRALFLPRLSGVVVSTSPPMCPIAVLPLAMIRRVAVSFWVMDLNPDQMIAAGMISARSLSARVLDWLNRAILRRADQVIALDRFMTRRLNAKLDVSHKLVIIPPWPHEDHLEVLSHADNPFRERHGLNGKFVVMYSGNHAIANPVTTILEAARQLSDDRRVVFMFIGGGAGKQEVRTAIRQHGLCNVISLPYQPLADLKFSLSAADLHVISIGDSQVGIVHPCKIYGALAVARPILGLAPTPSHVSDILDEYDVGWRIGHGDVVGAVRLVRQIASIPPQAIADMGARARALVERRFSKRALCDEFCDAVERANSLRGAAVRRQAAP